MTDIVVKYSTLAGGVFVEVLPGDHTKYTGNERCFRFDKKGNAEYALFHDLKENGTRARWYHHAYKEKDFLFA